MTREKKEIIHLDRTQLELQKLTLELMADIQDHKIQDALFKELIIKYVDLAKTLESKVEEITRLSETDPLTKVFNRHKLYKIFPLEEARVKRKMNQMSLIIFDIDHFKKVNDTFGHDVGDQVLIQVADIVKDVIRKTDIFVRWGGEEFIVLTPNGLAEGIELAERMRKTIMNYQFPKVQKVTVSFGVAEYLSSHDNLNSLTTRADSALYEAKQGGRNKVCFKK